MQFRTIPGCGAQMRKPSCQRGGCRRTLLQPRGPEKGFSHLAMAPGSALAPASPSWKSNWLSSAFFSHSPWSCALIRYARSLKAPDGNVAQKHPAFCREQCDLPCSNSIWGKFVTACQPEACRNFAFCVVQVCKCWLEMPQHWHCFSRPEVTNVV